MVLVLRGQHREQVPVPVPLGHIDRSFAAGVLECSPRQHADQPLGNLDRRAAVGGLVERGVERRPTRPCGVDQLLVFRDELEHPWPVGALGGVGEGVSDFGLSLLQHLGPRDSIPDDVHSNALRRQTRISTDLVSTHTCVLTHQFPQAEPGHVQLPGHGIR